MPQPSVTSTRPLIHSPDGRGAPAAAVDRAFGLMGTHMRIVVGHPIGTTGAPPAPEDAADRVLDLLRDYDLRLSRFREHSELSMLNRDPRAIVPATPLLRDAVSVAVHAAAATRGLVDPTVLDDLESVGYTDTWDPRRRVPLAVALREAPGRRARASGRPDRRWSTILVDDAAGTIARPPGLRIDTGGTGKGHAADLASAPLRPYDAWAVDCGGDVRLGGGLGLLRDVEVEHPFTGDVCDVLRIRDGAVATSGLRSRIWRDGDGRIAHHLLDPSTGAPAFTGVVSATAVAPTAVEAELRAKAALLAGPRGARAILARHGGVLVDDDGRVTRVGRPDAAPLLKVRLPRQVVA